MANSPLASHLISLLVSLPLYAVWLVGIVVALVRWQRHPSVSGLLAGGLAAMLLTSLAMRFGSLAILEWMPDPGLYLGILVIAGSINRLAGLIATLVALFGWRQQGTKAAAAPWQFSILGLMGVTLAVALLCGLARWLIVWLGESASQLIQLVDDIPVYICWLVGLGLAIRRWQQHPTVSLLAVVGIGMNLAITLAMQVGVFVAIRQGNFEWYRIIGAIASLLTAVAWGLLLGAVFADRKGSPFAKPPTSPAPPLVGR